MGESSFSGRSDAQLLALTAEQPQAFGAFYDRFEADVLRYFWRATRRADLAADLTAEVFALALASVRGYRPELGTPRAWLFGIARHELADVWTAQQVADRGRRRLGMDPLVLDDEDLERIEQIAGAHDARVMALLQSLPPDQQEAIRGRVLEELGYGELAERLACSQSVVRQRVSRGLRTLRGLIAEAEAR